MTEAGEYADKGRGTVYEHLLRAIEFSLAELGPHGLCLGLSADWNDCLNLKGRGETIFSTFLLLPAIRELLTALEHGAVLNSPSYADHDAEVGAITR